MDLLKTQKNTWHYLCEKRGEILYKAQEAEELGNLQGAILMRIAADSIQACMKALDYESK